MPQVAESLSFPGCSSDYSGETPSCPANSRIVGYPDTIPATGAGLKNLSFQDSNRHRAIRLQGKPDPVESRLEINVSKLCAQDGF